jgi:hypothetical protein
MSEAKRSAEEVAEGQDQKGQDRVLRTLLRCAWSRNENNIPARLVHSVHTALHAS